MTVSQLARLLDTCGVEHGPAADDVLPCFLQVDGEPLLVGAAVTSEGKIVQLRTVGWLSAPPGRHRRAFLTALMDMNFTHKLVKYAVDPDDQEVVAYLDLVLADARLTRKQLERSLRTFTNCVGDARKRLEKIVDSGDDPGEEEDEAALLARLLRETLEQAAANRQPRGRAPRDGEPRREEPRREEPEPDEPPEVTPQQREKAGRSGGRKSSDDAIDRMMRELEDEDDPDSV